MFILTRKSNLLLTLFSAIKVDVFFLMCTFFLIAQQRDTSQPDGKAESARVDGEGATGRSKEG